MLWHRGSKKHPNFFKEVNQARCLPPWSLTARPWKDTVWPQFRKPDRLPSNHNFSAINLLLNFRSVSLEYVLLNGWDAALKPGRPTTRQTSWPILALKDGFFRQEWGFHWKVRSFAIWFWLPKDFYSIQFSYHWDSYLKPAVKGEILILNILGKVANMSKHWHSFNGFFRFL